MKKRLLSLLLALVMVVSLFPGLSMDASAEGIADLFGHYFDGESIKSLFGDRVGGGYCGADSANNDAASVQFDIYEVTNPTLVQNNSFLEYLLGIYDYREDVQYYGVYIHLNPNSKTGRMKDYTISNESPWSSHHFQLDDGTEADLKEQIVVAYIDDGVTNVGDRAFDSIRMLTACYLGNSITTIGKRAFEKVEYLGAINMPRSLTDIYEGAFYGCNTLTFLRAGSCNQLETIHDRAFYSCTMLATIELPNHLETIGDWAFAWCRILGETTLTLPTSLDKIGTGAFAFCTHFKRLNIPKSVTKIGPYAFVCAFDMSELTFTDGADPAQYPLSIDSAAFAGCRTLTEVEFDNRVRSIGAAAFAACERLERVVFGTGINSIAERSFTSLTETATETLKAVIEAFQAAGKLEGWFDDEGTYTEEELSELFKGLTGITPLQGAAFNSAPIESVVAATDADHSFREECVVLYPHSGEFYYTWLASITADGKWKGYTTDLWYGHFHELEEMTIAPNCTDQGYTRHACTKDGCDYYYDDHFVDALGHQGELVKTIAPTCTTDGARFYQCTRAGCPHPKYVESDPALGHDTSRCVRVEPTCTTDGSLKGKCARCGETINEVIPAKGHNIDWLTAKQEPTCTTAGVYEGLCPDCGKQVTQVVPALGHDYSQCKYTAPTCTTAGSYDGTCQRCKTAVHDVVPALGHNYVETDREEPTDAADGSVTYTCANCGIAYSETLPRTACAGGASCPQAKFTDRRAPGFWSHSAIDYCVENGILYGVEDTRFGCTEATTRGQLVTMLYRMQGSPDSCVVGSDSVKLDKLRNPFTDTVSGSYYYDAVKWAYYNGIVAGTTTTTFSPKDPITREQMATILYNYTLKYKPSGAASSAPLNFPDAGNVSKYAVEPLQWAVANDIVSGTKENGVIYLDPKGTATREQVASILMRYQLNIAK